MSERDSTKNYETIVEEADPVLYESVKPFLSQIPDPRTLLHSESVKVPYVLWNPWKTLYEEINSLFSAIEGKSPELQSVIVFYEGGPLLPERKTAKLFGDLFPILSYVYAMLSFEFRWLLVSVDAEMPFILSSLISETEKHAKLPYLIHDSSSHEIQLTGDFLGAEEDHGIDLSLLVTHVHRVVIFKHAAPKKLFEELNGRQSSELSQLEVTTRRGLISSPAYIQNMKVDIAKEEYLRKVYSQRHKALEAYINNITEDTDPEWVEIATELLDYTEWSTVICQLAIRILYCGITMPPDIKKRLYRLATSPIEEMTIAPLFLLGMVDLGRTRLLNLISSIKDHENTYFNSYGKEKISSSLNMRTIFQSAVLSRESDSVDHIINFAKNFPKDFLNCDLLHLWSLEILNRKNHDYISSLFDVYLAFKSILRKRYIQNSQSFLDAYYAMKRMFNIPWIVNHSPDHARKMTDIIYDNLSEGMWVTHIMFNAIVGVLIESSAKLDPELVKCISKYHRATNSMVLRLNSKGIMMDRDIIKQNPDLIVSMEGYYTPKEKLEILGLTVYSKIVRISSNERNPWFTRYKSIWNDDESYAPIYSKREYLGWVAKEIANNPLIDFDIATDLFLTPKLVQLTTNQDSAVKGILQALESKNLQFSSRNSDKIVLALEYTAKGPKNGNYRPRVSFVALKRLLDHNALKHLSKYRQGNIFSRNSENIELMCEFPEKYGIIPFILSTSPEIASLQWIVRLLKEGYPPEGGFFFYFSRFMEVSISLYMKNKEDYIAVFVFSDICAKAVEAGADPNEVMNGITPIQFVNAIFTKKQKNQTARKELKTLLVKALTDVGGRLPASSK